MKYPGGVLGILATFIIITVFGIYLWFRIDIRPYYQALRNQDVQSFTSTYGEIAYVDYGEGAPLLVVHGLTGGWDQALSSGTDITGSAGRIIAPSRFGYPGSNLPENSTPQDQAAAYAQLLNYLNIESVDVLAVSAGGAPALAFALLYPERVRSLVLVSPAMPVPDAQEYMAGPPKAIYNDFLFWLMVRVFPGALRSLFGVSGQEYTDAGESERAALDRTIEGVLPIAPRREGVFNDLDITNYDLVARPEAYPLEEIQAPVLVVNAENDPMAEISIVREASDRFPHAQLAVYPTGGHILFGQDITSRVQEFLGQN
ncbi:MAG: alpha/beta fold hydrolase [Spirochaetia bacterium]